MRPLRAGVIGLGVGEQHVLGYRRSEGVEVVAICDVDPARLAEVGSRVGIDVRHTDFRKITEDDDIDIVSICSYDDAHAEQAISAFRHGKHVMVEKPVALTREDALAVMTAQQQSGRFISSNLILRAEPRFRELKQLIDSGRLGEIFLIEGDYLHDILHKITDGWRGRMDVYSTVFGGGIHLIDLMRWLLGREVVEVMGMGNDIRVRGTAYRWPDLMVNLLRFDGGVVGKTVTTFGPRRPKFHALNVYGSEATWVNDTPHARMWTGDRAEDEVKIETPYPGTRKGDLLPDFVAAIRADREPSVGADDVFRVMAVCLAAWESVRTGRPVAVDHLL